MAAFEVGRGYNVQVGANWIPVHGDLIFWGKNGRVYVRSERLMTTKRLRAVFPRFSQHRQNSQASRVALVSSRGIVGLDDAVRSPVAQYKYTVISSHAPGLGSDFYPRQCDE